jgi:hypothetical protein
MNPQDNVTNTGADELSLPPIQPQQPTAAPAPAPQAPAAPAPTGTPIPVQQAAPTPAQPAQQATQGATTSSDGTPLIADDTDLIEKEWVEKAKALVDQTKADPYTQNKEINKFKATYIKKRYNKDIQLGKD